MSDFYCDEVLSGKTEVDKVIETDNVLAYYHTRPSYQSHIVVIPKKHISSFTALGDEDSGLLLDLLTVAKTIARQTVEKYGACRVITNLGDYQDSKHLHWHIVYGSNRKRKRKLGFVDVPPMPDSFFDPLPDEELEAWGL